MFRSIFSISVRCSAFFMYLHGTSLSSALLSHHCIQAACMGSSSRKRYALSYGQSRPFSFIAPNVNRGLDLHHPCLHTRAPSSGTRFSTPLNPTKAKQLHLLHRLSAQTSAWLQPAGRSWPSLHLGMSHHQMWLDICGKAHGHRAYVQPAISGTYRKKTGNNRKSKPRN